MTEKESDSKPARPQNANLRRGGSPGRPKGVPNKATTHIKELATRILNTPAYLANLQKRVESGKVHPAVESMLHHYAYGKPKDVVQVEGSESLAEILSLAMARTGGSDGDSD